MFGERISEEVFMRELLKCSFCGFCEWVCPTLKAEESRLYGPRGRVNIIIFAIKDGVWTDLGLRSIFNCLVCGACNTQCPAGIKISEYIRSFRYYLISREFRPCFIAK
ncbi:MAG: (Fe-S)-binding protein [Aigarchaeota archaeon]|nr:(Fe-S)-binding protein [Aigarchaeota archaeon]MCX8192464.1 (Fe-S)-binding protein [Nitrososphaeria archaeon]MDW7986713.1 (Fe-S)-binding protein [Nitrososphaerota archaeon]